MVVITTAAAAFFGIGFGIGGGRDRADEQLKGGQNAEQ
jgi:hypothetical protein